MDERLTVDELNDAWPVLSPGERVEAFQHMARVDSDDFFLRLDAKDQSAILLATAQNERKHWLRLLAPDDAADLLQHVPAESRASMMEGLDDAAFREISALMAYEEDNAGGLMSPRFVRLRHDMNVREAIHYLQKQAQAQQRFETIYYAYVLDERQHLEGVVSFRQLFAAAPEKPISEVMTSKPISVSDTLDQEAVAAVMSKHDLPAIPVVDAEGRMKGIVTLDDIVDVVQREATEDIQKLGGMESLDTPYLQTGLFAMVRKRGGWLSALFLGELLTASAMSTFEDEIAKAVVLALFVPLIISSGGNSGSQATTLIIRAMALGEVRIQDWWRIMRREFAAGFLLGLLLATLGMTRILVWQRIFHSYGEHSFVVALTVAVSLIGVVTWGTLAGSMLPFVIRRLGFDPASASAPFVATLVDVSGLVIYFEVAQFILRGTIL